MMKLRRCIAFVVVIGFALVQFSSIQPASATGASWKFLELNSSPPNCDSGQLGLKTVVDGLADPSSPYLYDNIVSQNGQVYSDILNSQIHANGDFLYWSPQGQNDRGLKTHNYPLAYNDPITITLILRQMDGTALWKTVLSYVCNTGAIHVVFAGVPSGPAASGATTFFTPGDNRVDPHPGEQLAVWCNSTGTTPTIVVYGIASDQADSQKGFYLATFKNTDLLKAGAKGLTQQTARGTVSMMQDGSGHFYVVWNDGQAHQSNQGDFAKSFTCTFNS